MNEIEQIHEQALAVAKDFHRCEGAIIDVLMQVDSKRVFQAKGYTSLHQYATRALNLSDDIAYYFIRVARKSKTVPELKSAVEEGKITVNEARKICSVITPENQATWIDRASNLPQRDLEVETSKINPKPEPKERIKVTTPTRRELVVGISEELEQALKRVKDLLSQQTKSAVTLEEALKALTEEYLRRHDPIEKAKRLASRP